MNVVRRADGPLSAKHTLALLDLLQAHPAGRSEQLVIRDLAALHPVSWSRAHNTIALLRELDVLADAAGAIFVKKMTTAGASRWVEPIARQIAANMASRVANGSVRCLQARSNHEGLWFDSMLLPGSSEGLPFWIIEFAIATRDSNSSRFWRLAKAYESVFLDGARESNRRRARRVMTAAELEAKLGDDAIHGREAEEWVVEFERQRLAGHPLIDQIRRISEENVSAGYDILSFSTAGVLHHDLFIEAKSYFGSKRFFWSRTEIAEAEALGEEYSLYLVDRAKMRAAEYKPQIIRGPFAALIQSPGCSWSISPTTFECIASG